MNKSRVAHYLLCLALLFGVFGGLLGGPVVLAAQEGSNSSFLLPPSQEEPPPEEEEEPPEEEEEEPLYLRCMYPKLSGIAGDIFEFEMTIFPYVYKRFDFNVTTPPGWKASVWTDYPEKHITSIDFTDETIRSDTVKIKVVPVSGELPEPGEYVTIVELESEDIKESVDLTAVVTAKYELSMFTATGRLNTQAKAGEDNHLTIRLVNLGTAAIKDISFTSDKPEGWSITYNPDIVDSLEPKRSREVDVVITPAEKTIAGDYATTLKVNGRGDSETFSDSLDIRVAVLTPTIWGGVGIGIAAGVIASLVVLFRRLGRR